jgi:hypothetical protein
MSGRIVGRAFHDGQPIRDATLRGIDLGLSGRRGRGRREQPGTRPRDAAGTGPPPAESSVPAGAPPLDAPAGTAQYPRASPDPGPSMTRDGRPTASSRP